jgi:hypothetical protein
MGPRQLFALLILFGGFTLVSACGDDNDAFPATPTPSLTAPAGTSTPTRVVMATDTPTPVGDTPTPTDTPTVGTPPVFTLTPTPTSTVSVGPTIPFQCTFRTSYQWTSGPDAGQPCRPCAVDPRCITRQCEERDFFCKGGDTDGAMCPTAGAACPGGGRCQNSELLICTTSACPIVSRRVTGGSIIGSCTGDGSSCTAELEFFDPVDIPGIGFVCVEAIPRGVLDCPAGQLSCDGGPGLDYDLIQDHSIGPCGDPNDPQDRSGNSDCEQQCLEHCAAMGREMLDFGCSGYCKGGSKVDQKCICDSPTSLCTGDHCADPDPSKSGSCNGKDNLPNPNVCGCQCLETGGNPSRPGAMNFQVASQIIVEAAPPCGEGGVLLRLPPQCIPLTTETATGILVNANDVRSCPANQPTCNQIPNRGVVGEKLVRVGRPVTCSQLQSQGMSGVNLAGNISFFDSTLGDLETQLDWFCE